VGLRTSRPWEEVVMATSGGEDRTDCGDEESERESRAAGCEQAAELSLERVRVGRVRR
jgi:hypothetical protein